MVVFEQGKPLRNDYRKFKIKTVIGANDYASMEEVLSRRFARYFKEKDELSAAGKKSEEGKFTKLPDALFIDGGRGQVSVVENVLRGLNMPIPVCGMIKDDKHSTRGLIYNGEEIILKYTSEGFKLLTRIQDEVHRFAIEYHRKLREKAQTRSILDGIPGIGASRRKALLKHFGSIDAIRAAEIAQLNEAPSMNIRASEAVYQFFRQ
jgi:excinuclease ABC subunit C